MINRQIRRPIGNAGKAEWGVDVSRILSIGRYPKQSRSNPSKFGPRNFDEYIDLSLN